MENAALAQDSKGTWVAARSVHGWKGGDPPFRITFTADMTTDEQHQQHALAILEDVAKRPLNKIRMNFFGTSIEARGMKVVPKSLSQSAETGSAKQSFISFQAYDAAGVALGAEAKMEVQAFLDKFNIGEERPGSIGTFDFAEFPALLAALQDAKALEPRKSVLPRDQAWSSSQPTALVWC